MNKFDRADVEAPRRLAGNENFRATSQFAGGDDFLLISTTERSHRLPRRTGPNIEGLDEFFGIRPDGAELADES